MPHLFLNAARVDEPGTDLEVLLTVVSSFRNKVLPAKHVLKLNLAFRF